MIAAPAILDLQRCQVSNDGPFTIAICVFNMSKADLLPFLKCDPCCCTSLQAILFLDSSEHIDECPILEGIHACL